MYICSIATGLNIGFPGASTLANSILVSLEGAQARRFFGLLVPVLLAADGYAVYAYRKSARWDVVRDMVLPIAVGMFTGFLLLGRFDAMWMRKLLGVGVFVMGVIFYAVVRQGGSPSGKSGEEEDTPLPTKARGGGGGGGGGGGVLHVLKSVTSKSLFRALLAYVCGLLSIITQGSALILVLYLLSLNLAPRALNGTRANIFLIINLSKIPGQILLGNLHLSFDDAYIVVPLCLAATMSAYAMESVILPCLSQSGFERLSWFIIFAASSAMIAL